MPSQVPIHEIGLSCRPRYSNVGWAEMIEAVVRIIRVIVLRVNPFASGTVGLDKLENR